MSRRRRRRPPVLALLPLLVLALAALPALAQPYPERDVPAPLKPWVPWVLDEAREKVCPVVGEEAVCLWPGRLELALGESGGSFVLEAYADRPVFLPLPGDAKTWPQEVRLDGTPAVVVPVEDAPALRLAAGRHRVEGRLSWKTLPDSLLVPPEIALVGLTVDGKPRPFPRREEDGLLLLKREGEGEEEEEELRLQVFRKLGDGIPLSVETRLLFEASGKAREVKLSGALLDGAVPVSVSGELPARLDASGKLLVQVRAGRFTVSVLSRLPGKPERFARPPAAEPWPDEETWVFAPNEELRQAELSGAPGIDPSRTDLPEEWKRLAAYQLAGDAALVLKETRRGEGSAAPDQVSLARQVWLDLDGKGYSVRDRFGGTLTKTTRLELTPPGLLGRASVSGEDQLVTLDPATKGTGVELRQTALSMEADSRLPRTGGRLAAVGWKVDVQSLQATLFLPPGWRLLGASGVDRAPGAWIGSWSLLSFFLVLVVGIAAWRLLGAPWGGVALATLVAVHGEGDAPRLVWLSLLGAAALLTVAKGRIRVGAFAWWGVSALVLVLLAVPFSVRQVRHGLFPQTAGGGALQEGGRGGAFLAAGTAAPQAPPMLQEIPAPAPASELEQKAAELADAAKQVARPSSVAPRKKGYAYGKAGEAYRQDPHAVIQTGSGIPDWQWRSEALVWSGPVAADHTVRLWLLPPFANLLLSLLRVALVLLLAGRLAADLRRHFRPDLGPAEPVAGAGGGSLGLGLCLLLALGAPARAEEPLQNQNAQNQQQEAATPRGGSLLPDRELLDELRERLTRAPECAPSCVATPDVTLTLSGGSITVAAEVHAAAPAAWPLPGPVSAWVPSSVSVDGAPGTALVRHEDGFLKLRLPTGPHRVVLVGPVPPQDSFALQFPDRPRRIRAVAPGWQVDGVREDGTTDGAVQLSRRLAPAAGAAAAEGTYAPWLELHRVLEIGVSWRVETVVKRLSPTGSPVVVKVPLLPGMLVTDPDRTVKDGEVLLSLGRDETESGFSATLTPDESAPIQLAAASDRPWTEVWVVRCGTVWQCEAVASFPPVVRAREGAFAPEYRPWPGESLALTLRRPAGAPGQSVTIDRAEVSTVPGVRLTDGTLSLTARASRAASVGLVLPDGAELQAVKVRGSARPVKPEGSRVVVPVEPGSQEVEVTWRRKGGMSLLTRLPKVGLDLPAVNATLALTLPQDRWLLFLGGPRWGPAVLFWGYLLVVLLAALLLARFGRSPLAAWEWLLLGFGLTQLPLVAALLVGGWFLAMSWRRTKPETSAAVHDLVQVGLVAWTVAFAACLYAAVHQGLLLRPDMQVAGAGSSETLLRWYVDRAEGGTPSAWVLSLPLWVYRVVMLLWSLWLATRLVRWATWAWETLTAGGGWKRLRPERRPPPPPRAGSGAVPPPPPPPPPTPAAG